GLGFAGQADHQTGLSWLRRKLLWLQELFRSAQGRPPAQADQAGLRCRARQLQGGAGITVPATVHSGLAKPASVTASCAVLNELYLASNRLPAILNSGMVDSWHGFCSK